MRLVNINKINVNIDKINVNIVNIDKKKEAHKKNIHLQFIEFIRINN